MKIFNKSTNAVILGGVFFLIPLLIFIVLITHAIQLATPLGKKLVDVFDIHSVFGAATVTIFTIAILLFLCYISGYLVQKGLVNDWGRKVEDKLFLLFPSLQMLKYRLLGDKPTKEDNDNWKSILLKEDTFYRIAFITGFKEGFYSIYVPDAPRMDAGEIRFIQKQDIDFISISMKDAMNALNSFGRDGALEKYMMNSASKEKNA